MSVPHFRARSSKNAPTPEDGRRNDRPKRRANVNRLEVDVNRPRDFNSNMSVYHSHLSIQKRLPISLSKNRHMLDRRHLFFSAVQ